jgi:hypothetical protein
VHTYTKPQTSSTRSRGLGQRIHESVEDTKLSTNKQHTLSLLIHVELLLLLAPWSLGSHAACSLLQTRTHCVFCTFTGLFLFFLSLLDRDSLNRAQVWSVPYPGHPRLGTAISKSVRGGPVRLYHHDY